MVTGEFSMIITNVATNTEGDKTKVFAMSEGLSDLITNERRFTVEKRGDPEGIVAWRFISHDDQIDTEGRRARVRRLRPQPALPVDGDLERCLQRPHPARRRDRPDHLQQGQTYDGAYDPDPHYAFIGSPIGRSGPSAATVPGMIVRQVWISSRPRPAGL